MWISQSITIVCVRHLSKLFLLSLKSCVTPLFSENFPIWSQLNPKKIILSTIILYLFKKIVITEKIQLSLRKARLHINV